MRRLGAVRNTIRYLGSSRYRFQRKLARKLIAQIPEGGFRLLQAKHGAAEVNGWDYTKYLTIEHHMRRAARQATTLGLHESRPLRVLDLGCGSGYFLATARYLGHEVLGLDIPGNEMFDDTLSLLNIPRVDHLIESFAPLPELGRPFDLITGHQVWFNWTGRKDPWNIHEWSYFLDDCRSRLKSGGRMRFALNPGRSKEYRFLTDETAHALCQYPGAAVSDDKKILTVAP